MIGKDNLKFDWHTRRDSRIRFEITWPCSHVHMWLPGKTAASPCHLTLENLREFATTGSGEYLTVARAHVRNADANAAPPLMYAS